MDDKLRERREKIYRVSESAIILGFHLSLEQTVDCFRVAGRPVVPDGAIVMGVHHDFSRWAFCFVVWHESFDVVPAGQMIPYADDGMACEYVTAVKEESGLYRLHFRSEP